MFSSISKSIAMAMLCVRDSLGDDNIDSKLLSDSRSGLL